MTTNEQLIFSIANKISECFEQCKTWYGMIDIEDDDTGKDFLVDQMYNSISKANDRAYEIKVAFK